MDRALSVRPGAKWTGGVERKTTYAAALSPFGDASQVMLELTGLDIGASETDRIAQLHGERIDALQRAEEAQFREPLDPLRAPPEPDLRCDRMVLEGDATCVLTVGGEEHKSVYCGTVFGLDARGKSESGRHFITNRLYTGSAEDMGDFGERMKALAWRGGMRGARQTAFIGDGARCLWKWAEENLPPGTVFIQDFWHVCDHLSALAQALFGELWQPRFAQWKEWLRASHLDRILKELKMERQQRHEKIRKLIDEEITYLEGGQARMDYARYEQEGWPIGSGAIEATCKHLVKERFCVTGARWRRANIYKMLALRIAIFNQEWSECWEAYEAA